MNNIKNITLTIITDRMSEQLNVPSNEQLIIIKQIKDTNILVDAVAGSGKTTTVLHIARTYNEKKILLLNNILMKII